MVTKASSEERLRCPVAATIEIIGGRWKTLILHQLGFGTRRFGELAVRIPTISRKVLTEQLKELEKDGLVHREQFREIPPKVEYSLTELGRSLSPIFDQIALWGHTHILSKE
jgi:DNA-binding HxlR family transcriptional regulator